MVINRARGAVRLYQQRRDERQKRARWQQLDARRTLPLDHFETAVYFADEPVNLYHMRQWYQPLLAWNEHSPTVVICRDVSSALALQQECPLPVVWTSWVKDIERFAAGQRLRMVLYVNQNTLNLQMMRINPLLHVFINHGESDKNYMVTGQYRAYDYSFIAGEAAAQRLRQALIHYDVDARTRMIGRPQLDFPAEPPVSLPADDRFVVFYAPTWEGDRDSVAYGSVRSHGVAMVRALLATGRHRVIFRPHPRTGLYDDDQKAAIRQIADMITAANQSDPSAQHLFDQTASLDWQLQAADAAICDVSAAVVDWLATGKPIVVTEPTAAAAAMPDSGYLASVDLLPAAQAGTVADLLDALREDDEAARERMRWSEHYFGDTRPGAATQRWLAACREVVETCKAEVADLVQNGK